MVKQIPSDNNTLDNSPDEASPGGPAQPVESVGQVSSKKDSSLSNNNCSLDLKIYVTIAV